MSAATRPAVAVLDYGMGNLRSVEKALERAGARVAVTDAASEARRADGVVLPGVGAFPRAMESVRRLGLDDLVRERVARREPVLGICLGMQLLFERSEELGGADGIGILEGDVAALDAPGLKVPQIGWNAVSWRKRSPLVSELPDPCPLYHVHSFAPRPADPADVLGTATYGSEFVTAVERGVVAGCQFHPEKSGAHGLALLRAFVARCAGVPAAV